MPKKSSVRTLTDSNMLKRPKDHLNLHGRIFVIVFDDSESKSAPKILF